MRQFFIIDKFKEEGVNLPKRQTHYSAGYDFETLFDETINPGQIVLIKTGLKVAIPEDEVLLVFPRSSLAINHGLTMANNVGVIDADYYNNPKNEGHIMIPLLNYTNEPVIITKGTRVAQGIFVNYFKTNDDQPLESNRKGGFGSSN